MGLSPAVGKDYPLSGLPLEKQRTMRWIESCIPPFVNLLIHHRPKRLQGKSLQEVMKLVDRSPRNLREHFAAWRKRPTLMQHAPPTLVFATLEQARADGLMGRKWEVSCCPVCSLSGQ